VRCIAQSRRAGGIDGSAGILPRSIERTQQSQPHHDRYWTVQTHSSLHSSLDHKALRLLPNGGQQYRFRSSANQYHHVREPPYYCLTDTTPPCTSTGPQGHTTQARAQRPAAVLPPGEEPGSPQALACRCCTLRSGRSWGWACRVWWWQWWWWCC
jgi:hypothetical protein